MTRFWRGVARALLDRDGPLKITKQLSSTTAAIAGGVAGPNTRRPVLRKPARGAREHEIHR